jgi:serine/threonine-protein kinase
VTLGFESTSPGRVLESLARSIGSIPRVLLPDTQNDDRGVAVIKPSSPEMPPAAERGGRYQLFGEIARGGMGAVLKGRDPDLGRDLAVKVLLEGHRDKPDLLRRFVEEAQIGGQLQHPGIVPVYELGTFADSRPYFTMKLVKGRTLAQLLKERPSPREELPRFLGIFEQVCQTVAYAHARGVIHRDLKPTNIMVGSFGEVQLMDWGLAKVLKEGGIADEPPVTNEPVPAVSVIQTVRSGSGVDISVAGSALGTPAYMAPEQAGGDIEHVDRRADVFGLGSILCEILTGQPAYTGRTQPEVMRKAMRGDTGDALVRLDGCGADGELICLARECLAAEAEDRPRDAGVVAGRVAAYRAGVQERLHVAELARARADARAEEERKRRRLALALAAAVVCLIAVGGTGAAVYWQQRRDAAARLALVLREAHLLRDQAAADPNGDPAKWRAAEAAARRAGDLLGPLADAGARREVQALSEEVAATAQAVERDAALLRAVVDIRSKAEDRSGLVSDPAYAAAFRDAGLDVDVLGPDAVGASIRARPAGVALSLAVALDEWASRRRAARPKDEAGWGRLIAAARAVYPDPTRERLRALWAQSDPKAQRGPLLELAREADPRAWPAASLSMLARALYAAEERDAAVALLRRAQAHQPGDVWLSDTLAAWLEAMRPPRTEEAIGYYRAARALRPETAHELAHLLERQGRGEEAVAVFEDLVRLRPGDGRHWLCYGRRLQARGDRAGADAALEKAVVALREAIRLQPDVGRNYHNLGQTLSAQGKVDEAIAEFRQGSRLLPEDAQAHISLGAILSNQKHDYAGAEVEFREAIRLQPDDAIAHDDLGNALDDQGKRTEAIAEFREAIRLRPDYAGAHNNLAFALMESGDLAGAMPSVREALRIDPGSGPALATLAEILLISGRFAEAVPALERAAVGRGLPAGYDTLYKGLIPKAGRLAGQVNAPRPPAAGPEGLAGPTANDLAARAAADDHPALAARIGEVILDVLPRCAGDLKAGHRDRAARAAARAGCGRGKDDPPPTEAERAELRRLALGWLRADLTAWGRVLDAGDPKARADVAPALRRWRADPDLAGVRDPQALAKLPSQEQKAWRDLWSEVDTLLKKAQGDRP